LAAAFARDLKLPLVFTFHTRYDEYAHQYVPLVPGLAGMLTAEIVGRYLEKCAAVIAPTPSIRDLIWQEYGASVPVVVVPTPVDLSAYHDLDPGRIRTTLNLEDAEVLMYVGRLVGEKNLDFLIRAFARIAPQRPQARLVLVGDGTHRRELENTARKLELGERVIFPGSIPPAEVPHHAAAAGVRDRGGCEHHLRGELCGGGPGGAGGTGPPAGARRRPGQGRADG
jgi:1,2-diacylglycerol 3-alpha-glucosyltransferase